MGEERRAVDALERGLAGAHRLEQARGGAVVDLAAHARGAGQRLELLADRGQREAPVGLLDHVLEREPAQDARERGGVGPDALSELSPGQWAIGERTGDAELLRDVEQLRHDVAVQQAEELPLRFDVYGFVVESVKVSVLL